MQIMVKYWDEYFPDTNFDVIYDEGYNISAGVRVLRYFSKADGLYTGIIRYNGGRVKNESGKVTVTTESFYYAEKIFNTLQDILQIQASILSKRITAKN